MAEDRDLNRDPLTDETGAHPVGTGVGAAGGAVGGAAAGTVGGPVGAVVGGVIGAVVGGLAGKAAAEAINPTAEEAHWRDRYTSEPYYERGRSFDDYGPAYMHGVRGRTQYETDWDAAEPQLAADWATARAESGLSWEQARPASRAAWDRLEARRRSQVPGSLAGSGGTDMAGTGADRGDVVDVLKDLVECCKDGEYGFRESAQQVKGQDLRQILLRRADDCRRGAEELNEQIRGLGGAVETGGSALGALHRGWVSVRSKLSTYDDKAVLEECERGEDNAVARYRKALQKTLPAQIRQLVERQFAGVQRNHDDIRRLRNQERAQAGTAAATGSSEARGAGVAAAVGAAQSAGNTGGDRDDVIDALQDLVECCKDGEYGFRACAEQASRQDLKTLFRQRADDCHLAAEELNRQIRSLGGSAQDSGSALGALHRGWVAVRTKLTSYDDKAVLEECERGEDNAMARYRKALKQSLPAPVRQLVEQQAQAVQQHHDRIKMLRDQARAMS